MNMRRMAALQAGLLLATMLANGASKNSTMRIRVLDSETRSVSLGDSSVPNNCDGITFDAYCRSSRTALLTNTLLVQEGDGPPFRIACTIDSRFSRCTPLPKGESFDARREKHGITVYYQSDDGKPRKQLYTLVASDAKEAQPVPAAAVTTDPVPAPHTAAAVRNSSAPATLPPAAHGGAPDKVEKVENIKCNFTSTPPGAEISLDGKYVGSTPSSIDLSTGTHVVVFSLPGFAQWKRDLTVLPGSQLTVNAILQKEP
jgi:hypothetical protein